MRGCFPVTGVAVNAAVGLADVGVGLETIIEFVCVAMFEPVAFVAVKVTVYDTVVPTLLLA